MALVGLSTDKATHLFKYQYGHAPVTAELLAQLRDQPPHLLLAEVCVADVHTLSADTKHRREVRPQTKRYKVNGTPWFI